MARFHIPVLTLHTKGDGLVVVEDESAYKDVVDEEHDGELLRQLFVHRAGHCEFTPAETVVAFQALISRLDTGKWPGLGSATLNKAAKGAGIFVQCVIGEWQGSSCAAGIFQVSARGFLTAVRCGEGLATVRLNFNFK